MKGILLSLCKVDLVLGVDQNEKILDKNCGFWKNKNHHKTMISLHKSQLKKGNVSNGMKGEREVSHAPCCNFDGIHHFVHW